MKYGVRKLNAKKSIKARTTGKMKRQVKKAVNPLYGKKGMGVINNPKKAAYNAVYNRTTVGVSDVVKSSSTHKNASTSTPARISNNKVYSDRTYNLSGIILMVCGVLLVILGLPILLVAPIGGLLCIVGGICAFIIGRKYKKSIKEYSENKNDVEEA